MNAPITVGRVALLAIACSVITTVVTHGALRKLVPMPRPQIVHANTAVTSKHVTRQAARQWDELEQAQVDGLTGALATINKRSVVILCKDRSDCGDLALDLENAFESAKWDVKIDAPVLDSTVGVASNDNELAGVVGVTTGLKVNVVPKAEHHPVFVVIGRKP